MTDQNDRPNNDNDKESAGKIPYPDGTPDEPRERIPAQEQDEKPFSLMRIIASIFGFDAS